MCVRYNTSVVCKPKVFRDSKLWTIHKAKVDDRIDSLKRRLLLYKVAVVYIDFISLNVTFVIGFYFQIPIMKALVETMDSK